MVVRILKKVGNHCLRPKKIFNVVNKLSYITGDEGGGQVSSELRVVSQKKENTSFAGQPPYTSLDLHFSNVMPPQTSIIYYYVFIYLCIYLFIYLFIFLMP